MENAGVQNGHQIKRQRQAAGYKREGIENASALLGMVVRSEDGPNRVGRSTKTGTSVTASPTGKDRSSRMMASLRDVDRERWDPCASSPFARRGDIPF